MANHTPYAAEDIHTVLSFLEAPKSTQRRHALIGFDGYMDTLYRVIKTRGGEQAQTFYSTIAEYGARIMQAAGKSADIDLHQLGYVLGGNAPLMANGLAHQGTAVTLIGALGYPELNPVFESLHEEMRIYSFANPCQTIALEFDDGKVMMGDLRASRDISWARLLSVLGEATVLDAIASADLIGIVNWSAHQGIPDIARGIGRILQHSQTSPATPKKLCFFDLSDPTSLSQTQLRQHLQDIAEFATFSDTVLSLNENEACAVFRTLYPQAFRQDTLAGANLPSLGKAAMAELGLHLICIHMNACSFGFFEQEAICTRGFHVKKPKVSTGGGDNFNAGLCYGLLEGLTLPQCLLLASGTSSFFVTHGRSADRAGLAAHVRQCLGQPTPDSQNNTEEESI